jgi:hypothetical protein
MHQRYVLESLVTCQKGVVFVEISLAWSWTGNNMARGARAETAPPRRIVPYFEKRQTIQE